MRIGVFGGTFNPPHLGHKRLAQEIKEFAELDKIIVIPTFQPPHKESAELASSADRLEMCRIAFNESFFSVSEIEIEREGKSYTFDTLCRLKELYPADELFLIIGSDMLLSFDKWYRYKDILSMAHLAVTARESYVSADELRNYAEEKLALSPDEYIVVDVKPFECSSTMIREKLKAGESIESFADNGVVSYIFRKGLYSDKFASYKSLLKEKLDQHRYIHSLGVADSAAELADIYGYNKEKAYLAGLLHDIMKNATTDEQLQIMKKGGIIPNQVEKNNKNLWHAMAGEAFLKLELNITDSEILSAVRYHTTGRKGMCLLEKLIYVADYISAERNYPDVEVMRSLAKNNSLEEASLYALKFFFKKACANDIAIHTDSVDYYNELIINKKGLN